MNLAKAVVIVASLLCVSRATYGTAVLVIETIEVRGTTRLSSEDIQSAINLRVDDDINDERMNELRARLLGLGLFQDVLFSLQKGSDRTKAKLIISVVDDKSVTGTAAMGGEFGLLATDGRQTVDDGSPFRSYHFGLIARNLFRTRHRAAFSGDMDVKGSLAAASAAYGLPRFEAEAVQFDASVAAVDPQYRYYDTMSFGLKIQSMWTRSIRFGDLQYGGVWYTNTHKRYRLTTWPEVVAGPRVGFVHDTRFLGFMPSEGWRVAFGLIPSLVKRNQFVTESQLAGTLLPIRHIALSAELQATTVGNKGVTSRGELKLVVPITDRNADGTKAVLFTALRQGYDHYETVSLSGSDALLGIRYHSTAFIGELTFQVTRKSPFTSKLPKTGEKDVEP